MRFGYSDFLTPDADDLDTDDLDVTNRTPMRPSVLLILLCCITAQLATQSFPTPVNGVTPKTNLATTPPLPYEPVREADVAWEKTIWRVIDVQEKMNHPFANPERPLYTILTEAAEAGRIQLYEDDDFTRVLRDENRQRLRGTIDTVTVVNPLTGAERQRVIVNTFDPRDVKRYRLKEVWFLDRKSSTLKVRILGISPLQERYDENGNFQFELPLYWVYFPGARRVLARQRAPLPANVRADRSWDDLFQSRFFASTILKESNLLDRRIEDYLSGRDALLAGEKIGRAIFDYEEDLWAR